MKIEIQSEVLIANQLSPNQYCYLYSKSIFPNVSVVFSLDPDESLDLEDKGFIKRVDSGIALREKAYQLFEETVDEKRWFEFKSRYPIKSGERRLHDNQEKCRNRYMTLIKSKPGLHERILKGLDNEYKARLAASNKRQFFPDWKMMSVWLNQKNWETYIDYEGGSNEVVDKTEAI